MVRAIAGPLLVALLALPADAQILSVFSEARDRLTIDVTPEFPGAGETIFFTVRGLSTDLDRADIAWYVDNRLIATGSGVISANATLGPLGSRARISVSVTSEEGSVLEAERTLRPAEVDLLWEGNSYVPPFYAGKRLASPDGTVRAEAIPRLRRENGTSVADTDIIYTWRRNDGIVAEASGRGKSSALFSSPELFGNDTIEVEAASLDGSLIARSSVRIPSIDPFVMLYVDHPLFGMLYHASVGASQTLSDIEATFAAVPYFAPVDSPNDSRLAYAWRVNGDPIAADPKDPSRLTMNAKGSNGEARVELSLTHATSYIMRATGVWNIVLNSGLGGAGIDLFGGAE